MQVEPIDRHRHLKSQRVHDEVILIALTGEPFTQYGE